MPDKFKEARLFWQNRNGRVSVTVKLDELSDRWRIVAKQRIAGLLFFADREFDNTFYVRFVDGVPTPVQGDLLSSKIEKVVEKLTTSQEDFFHVR